MRRNGRDKLTERIADVLALVRSRITGEQREHIERFVREHYRQVDPDELASRAPEDLYGAAISHWKFAGRRQPGNARVRVFNPSVEEHGWQSTHTVVQIVNDDMPFLVDSVTMAVNRRGLTLHHIIHPILAVNRDVGGTLNGLAQDDEVDSASRESFMHIEVDRLADPAEMDALAHEISRALADVRAAVADWTTMRGKVAAVLGEIARRPPPLAY